jgi:hypothetical protein
MKNYFEKKDEKNFESMNSTFYSHREGGFKNLKISGSRRIEEIKDFRKSKFDEVEELKKSKISGSQSFQEVEV